MINLVPISLANAMTYKEIRLRALQDTPNAFGSTYAKESKLSDEDWCRRAAQWNSGEKSAAYLAMDGDQSCGIAGGYFPEDGSGPYLIAMWVAASHRRRGVGRLLVNAIVDWARSRGAESLVLDVTTTNDAAIGFYEDLGFVRTGTIKPYPNDPALQEYEMSKALG
ncbi:MAG: GNAT family N-acetyltransferase [Anaerolineae bacterium]|nr:GNAT family N-acetyltransferase [Phycisphaerae bacterium]